MAYYQGKFNPKNPKKYLGDPRNIVYRSFWELRTMAFFDANPNVLSWQSEETQIPYISPADNQYHRYFPDFIVKMKQGEGYRIIMMEIKPHDQVQKPKQKLTKTKKPTKRFLVEAMTWSVNQAKWEAAKEYCDHKGWDFIVITEKNVEKLLGIKFG